MLIYGNNYPQSYPVLEDMLVNTNLCVPAPRKRPFTPTPK